jgi:hypothetical protein
METCEHGWPVNKPITVEGVEPQYCCFGTPICGCRDYPEYGDACLLPQGHIGPHDWQKSAR